MYQDDVARLSREPWGDQVFFDQDYVSTGFQAILRAMEAAGIQVQGFPDRPMQPAKAHGVNGLRDELSLMFGKPQPLTQRDKLTVQGTLENGDSTALVNINAYSNDPDATPAALGLTGSVIVVGGGITLDAGQQITIGGAQITLDALDLTGISGYSSSSIQLLGHDASGDLKWYDTSSC